MDSSWAKFALFNNSQPVPELRSPTLPGASSPSSPRSFLPVPMTTSRGLSPPRSPGTIKTAASTPNIRKMAAVANPSATMVLSPTHFRLGSDSLSTLRDPRSESDLRGAAARDASPHADLSLEVASLSNKLISAINHSTNLDDALATMKDELRRTQHRLKETEARAAEHDRQMSDGSLVRREEVEERTSDLFRKYSVEKRARELADREKRAIESELAELSTKLFEEANQLVVKARKETEAAENRTEQVRAQLTDTEALLASHQEQLVELKAIMEKLPEQDEAEAATRSSAPSTPAPAQASFDTSIQPGAPQFGHVERPDPVPSLDLSHLITPILRNDVPAFEDFRGLLEINRRIASAPPSRVTSGTYSNASFATSSATISPQPAPSNASSTNLGAVASQPHSPSHSTNSTASGSNLYSPTFYPLLKETKFFKRALVEDIDPTLRLDAAPGLSFFARRSVTAAVNDNTLVLEPLPSSSKKMITSCTLCGERRRGDDHARTHRFKAGDESAQWYPLCAYCVGRLRSTCDYIGFLRMVRDGFWRCEGEKGEEKAWEETVRLRERMFWSRIGGGVVPSDRDTGFESKIHSKRPSVDVGMQLNQEINASPTKDTSTREPITPPEGTMGKEGEIPVDEQMPEIRELSSTAPPLKVSSASASPTNTFYPRSPRSVSNGFDNPSVTTPPATDAAMAEPLRQSLAASLRRISLRESLRFGAGNTRSDSKDRAGNITPSLDSPKLGAVAEMKAVYEGRVKDDEPAPAAAENVVKKEESSNNDSSNANGVPDIQDAEKPQESESKASRESGGLNISLPGGFN